MSAENNITVVGNLARDPELRFTAAGRAVASFGIAVNRRYQVNGEWQEQVSFFNVVAWGELGENAAASLAKGSRVIVSGRLESREFEGKDGVKKTAVEIVADDLGVSLRWATVEVELVARKTAAPVGKPAEARHPKVLGTAYDKDETYAPTGGWIGDEEPF